MSTLKSIDESLKQETDLSFHLSETTCLIVMWIIIANINLQLGCWTKWNQKLAVVPWAKETYCCLDATLTWDMNVVSVGNVFSFLSCNSNYLSPVMENKSCLCSSLLWTNCSYKLYQIMFYKNFSSLGRAVWRNSVFRALFMISPKLQN